jgi:CRISPR system Cascade subunit CasA
MAEWISPADLTTDLVSDPVVSPNWGRADLDALTIEFLIALLTTSGISQTREQWIEYYKNPPAPSTLASGLEHLEPFFNIAPGAGAFMQDRDPLDDADENLIAALLIGGLTEDNVTANKDLFNKRDAITAMGFPAAAISLFGHQTWATSGGRGYRTSPRGGGPLSVIFVSGATLWSKVWTSVETWDEVQVRNAGAVEDLAMAFPWMNPTRPSKDGSPIIPEELHPLAVYWAMPRRVRLVCDHAGGQCSITGRNEDVLVRGFRVLSYGNNYPSEAWSHPFAAYYRDKPGGAYLPRRPSTKGLGLRDYLGLVVKSSDENLRPSRSVTAGLDRGGFRRKVLSEPKVVLAHGYVTDNARGVAYLNAAFDVAGIGHPELDMFIERAVKAQDLVVEAAIFALKSAERDRLKGFGGERFDHAAIELHRLIETRLNSLLKAFSETFTVNGDDGLRAHLSQWLDAVRPVALQFVEARIPIDAAEDDHVERRVAALSIFRASLHGYGKAGAALFKLLDRPVPEIGTKAKKKGDV